MSQQATYVSVANRFGVDVGTIKNLVKNAQHINNNKSRATTIIKEITKLRRQKAKRFLANGNVNGLAKLFKNRPEVLKAVINHSNQPEYKSMTKNQKINAMLGALEMQFISNMRLQNALRQLSMKPRPPSGKTPLGSIRRKVVGREGTTYTLRPWRLRRIYSLAGPSFNNPTIK